MAGKHTPGELVRAIFRGGGDEVTIIAPFIKVEALRSILAAVPQSSRIRCVTRWLPRDIAAGVSDPEIINVLEERGNFSLSLVDVLHAKLYIGGNQCLVGSSNVTFPGLGEAREKSNIEILVVVSVDDPGVTDVLNEISRTERMATRDDASMARRMADSLSPLLATSSDGTGTWFPRSRRPQRAFEFYKNVPVGYLASAEKVLLGDVAMANIQPGFDEDEFRASIRFLLSRIPFSRAILTEGEDVTLTRADAQSYLEVMSAGEFSVDDLWRSFVSWMSHFYSDQVMKQEISDIGLRRAQTL
jgi:hypothetical protein